MALFNVLKCFGTFCYTRFTILVPHGRTQPKIAGGGAVRGSEGHPADNDDLASEKGHLLSKSAGQKVRP